MPKIGIYCGIISEVKSNFNVLTINTNLIIRPLLT